MFVLRILVLLLLIGIWMKHFRLVGRPACRRWHLDTAIVQSKERTKFVSRISLLGLLQKVSDGVHIGGVCVRINLTNHSHSTRVEARVIQDRRGWL